MNDSTTPRPGSDTPPEGPPLRTLLRWLLGITRPVHPPLLASLLFRIVALTLDIALFATAAGGVAAFVAGGGTPTVLLIVLVVLALAKAAFFYLEQFSGHYVAFKALELLRTYVFAQLWPKAPAIVAHSRSGDILTSLTRDVDRIEVVYAHTFAPVVSAYVVGPAAILVAGLLVGWGPTGIAVGCLLLSLCVVPYLGVRRAHAGTERTIALRRNLSHQVTDSVFGRNEVVGYAREEQRLQEMDALGLAIARSARGPRDLAALRRGANVILSLLAVVSVVWLGRPSLSIVAVAALAAGTLRAFEGPRGIEDATGYLDHSIAAARRLWQVAHTPQRVLDGPDRLDPTRAPAVTFAGVTYAYPEPDGRLLPATVRDVDLHVPAGGHAILVGRSGSGKSTLAHLLLRYDDPQSGHIAIDGIPVTRLTLDSLRRTVVSVSQRNQLLDATIADNLRLGAPDASEQHLWEAVETAGIRSEIEAMPDRLGTPVGPNGSALSGGQAQRLCLARALLMRPRVLVLDEFTANLDADLEARIRGELTARYPDLTILEITHRLRATAHADVVAVVDRGRIVLSGGPDTVTADAIEALIRAPIVAATGAPD